ncbi:MAG TPA: nuclear transport factor 2 family protein [Burkholderiaceae bacterium]
MLLNHRHRELIKALASGQREAARAFYGERAIIAGPEIVGPFESIMVNRVDNPHGAFLSLPTPIHGYKAYGSSRCNVEVTSGNYTSSPDGGGLRLPFTIVWIKVDGEWKVLFHHIEAPR